MKTGKLPRGRQLATAIANLGLTPGDRGDGLQFSVGIILAKG
jgi:hypothetical protein